MKITLDQMTVKRTAMAQSRRRDWFAVDEQTWSDWQWQQANRIRSVEELEKYFPLRETEKQAIKATADTYRMAITPYYLTLIDPECEHCPIRKQAIPTMQEEEIRSTDLVDPLAEEKDSPVPGITHRYPDRVLFYTTHNCPVYCRHCNRRRKVSMPETMPPRDVLEQGVRYIAENPEVRDVLVSGGDPLTFSDTRLQELLASLYAIEHLDIIRLATRNPVTLPQRITPKLAEMLKRFAPIYVSTHFNHPQECTEEAAQALALLVDAGCVVNNQMVLLKGVNDGPETVLALNRWLLRHRCQPYYIFQLDNAEGISHFRTPISSGVKIIESLRGWTSGMAVPHYVVDLPGGGGKVSVQPNYFVEKKERTHIFRNYRGEVFEYEEGSSLEHEASHSLMASKA
ncbi:MAG: lysine 2,3-aminomutase [Myxococcales bacterium]|nr:lysine 2,3-aminomutase [Myxococcales bacterium]